MTSSDNSGLIEISEVNSKVIKSVFRDGVFIFKLAGSLHEASEIIFRCVGLSENRDFFEKSSNAATRARRTSKHPYTLYRIELKNCPTPIREFEIFVRSNGDEHYILCEKGHELTRLFPKNANEYAAFYNKKKNRPKDQETTAFAVRQIIEHYRDGEAQIVSSTVIYTYKSLELGNRMLLQHCKKFISSARDKLPDLLVTNFVRTDRNHLESSLTVCEWHHHIYERDLKSCLNILEINRISVKKLDNPMAITTFNHCRSFLLHAYISYLQGKNNKVRSLTKECLDFYTKSVANLQDNTTFFGEIRESHEAVYQCMLLRDSLKFPKIKPSNETVFKIINRLLSHSASSKLREGFDAICHEAENMPLKSTTKINATE